MTAGIIRHWDRARGYGVVVGDDRIRYFVHRSELVDILDLTPGPRVEFVPEDSPKGPRAAAVPRVEAW